MAKQTAESDKKLTITLKCFYGFEDVLMEELQELGYTNLIKGNRAVSLNGTWRDVYYLNLYSRCAINVLVEITRFPFRNEKDIYDAALTVNWSNLFHERNTFAVRGAIQTKKIRNTHYPFLLVKDAVVDHFKELNKERPSIDTKHPKIGLDLYLTDYEGVISLNTSGLPLFQRGYRIATGIAPINEVVAASLIRLSGWDRKQAFYDPFCGAGTFLIEAALLATGIPSNIERTHYAFKNLNTFDANVWQEIIDQAPRIVKELPCKIGGSDISDEMVLKTRRNLRGFSFGRFVSVQSLDFNTIEANPEIEFLMCNPPYDERLSLEDEALYQQLGTWLKHKMQGVPAWIISSNEEGWKAIGLKPSKKYEVFNGDLRCSFRRYDTFAGSKASVTENDIKKA
jgi:putative N6-adenine-specific DNA methylase